MRGCIAEESQELFEGEDDWCNLVVERDPPHDGVFIRCLDGSWLSEETIEKELRTQLGRHIMCGHIARSELSSGIAYCVG